MTTTRLPPLPTPKGKVYFEAEPYQPAWVSSSDAFDDEQMQAYATQARADLEAENKRLRGALVWIERRCPRIFLEQSPHKIHWEAANDAGACARAALESNP